MQVEPQLGDPLSGFRKPERIAGFKQNPAAVRQGVRSGSPKNCSFSARWHQNAAVQTHASSGPLAVEFIHLPRASFIPRCPLENLSFFLPIIMKNIEAYFGAAKRSLSPGKSTSPGPDAALDSGPSCPSASKRGRMLDCDGDTLCLQQDSGVTVPPSQITPGVRSEERREGMACALTTPLHVLHCIPAMTYSCRAECRSNSVRCNMCGNI